LAVVIAKKATAVPEAESMDYVLGFTCLNDVTARDLQKKDGQWTRGKGFDTFCPVGPWIETELNYGDVQVTSRLNGVVRQQGRTSLLITDIPKVISYISHIMTLNPGDVIATGTPAGVGPMKDGDIIEIEVEGIGILRNPVKA
jgi:2-keto-4-pentenoate hydratase/2-oxohepta-3-ene-1,7-dioic acid hydratase in catechol pathway